MGAIGWSSCPAGAPVLAVTVGRTLVSSLPEEQLTFRRGRQPLFRVVVAATARHERLVVLGAGRKGSYLVDSASSHMLVSKIKPCMSKCKQFIL